jgi:hypothetical protein
LKNISSPPRNLIIIWKIIPPSPEESATSKYRKHWNTARTPLRKASRKTQLKIFSSALMKYKPSRPLGLEIVFIKLLREKLP